MENSFIIHSINNIILVEKKAYPENRTIFKSKFLRYHELIYHFSGKSTVYFNQKKFNISANTIRYLPVGNCEKYIVERTEHGECIDIFFASNLPLNEEAFVLNLTNEKIAALFKKIFSVWVQKDEGYYFKCISILYNILAEMQKKSYTPSSLFNKIKPAVEYIQEHFLDKEPITSEKLVSLCSISYSYIKRIFTLTYKTSPKRYILQLKMNYASDLLRYGEHTVSKIAELCGYGDVYTFSRQFKIDFGLSPMDFQKKYKSSK